MGEMVVPVEVSIVEGSTVDASGDGSVLEVFALGQLR